MRSSGRVKTGIPGLDEILEGGLPPGRVYIVAGEAGTGKTIFSTQFIVNGIEMGENGILVTIDVRPEHIIEDSLAFGWDLERLMDENKLLMAELTEFFSDVRRIDPAKIADNLKGYIDEIGAERLVIDPIAPLVIGSSEPLSSVEAQMYVRNYLRKLFHSLEEIGVTTLGTSEIPTGTRMLSRYGVEEFLASGVIVLRLYRSENIFNREIYILKMRGVNHSMRVYPFIIQSGRGIIISI